ncbi:MAG: efflux RND transporter periplasmic adaptor subunit [Acidobacteriota bacterium]|nr:efflux RND transporter periplasmic adaptor subunit [Acidobacteriota bacterium]
MGKRYLIGAIVVLLVAGTVAGGLYFRKKDGLPVNGETIQRRNLTAIVSASGTIQPKRSVNISADTIGRVTQLAVQEGERVKAGQFLLQIDPRSLQTAVNRGQASLDAERSSLAAARVAVQTAQANLSLAQETLRRQKELWSEQLTTRQDLDTAQNDVNVKETELKARQADVVTQQERIKQQAASLASARYDLSKVTIVSPIDGIVTRRNIEEGEMVLVGTMNNAGTVLLTIADMSVIQAEVNVDETDVPNVQVGQPAAVSVDAYPDRTFKGHVTEIGNSPIQNATSTSASTGSQQATNFKVDVRIDEPIPDVRPGFTCTADITTATRTDAIAVPIQSVTTRELVYDAQGHVVPQSGAADPLGPAPLQPGQTRKETEGVFVIRNGKAVFVPITIGIAGDRYFEVLSGLQPGDVVITGPYNSVRQMKDGDAVRLSKTPVVG